MISQSLGFGAHFTSTRKQAETILTAAALGSRWDCRTLTKETGVNTAVVIISGHFDYQIVRRAFRMGVCDYLRKPYDVDELIRVVGTTIAEQNNTRRHTAGDRLNPITSVFFQHALDHLPDLILSLDDRLCINYLNDRIESLLGVTKTRLLGRPMSHLVHADDVAKIPLLCDRTKAAKPATHEIRLRTRNEEIPYLACEITVVSPPVPNLWAPYGSERLPTSTRFLCIVRDITERKQVQALMEFRASHDSLTGLPNRTLFMDRLALAVSQAIRNGKMLGVLFIDLNDFKAVNDTHGHGVGDQLLQNVATALKNCLRDGDTLSRYGGDEFTVLLPSLDGKSDAATVARNLLKSLQNPFRIKGVDTSVTVGTSIGIAIFPEDGVEAEALLERADKAMYDVKQTKKNDFFFYSGFGSPSA